MIAFHATAAPIYQLLSLIVFGLLTPALAQVATTITPDGSLGTTVSQNGFVHTIDGGTIRGPNQFHSFEHFDVGTDDVARFAGPMTVVNILSRVVGGTPSIIDGTLQSEIPGAHLYLLNPSGVLLGPRARLDVKGSFHVSTADVVRLGEDGAFHVSIDEQSAISVSAPSTFGFLRDNPSGIRIVGSRLVVPTHQTLSVIGGDLDVIGIEGIFGFLAAPSGQVDLVSVASPGEIALLPLGSESDATLESFARLGAISLTDFALVDVSSEAGGGTVVIRGGSLTVDNAFMIANTFADVNGAAIGIDIHVAEAFSHTRGCIEAGALGAGHSGDIQITANRIAVTEGAQINSFTAGPGAGGNVMLRATEMVSLRGTTPDGRFSSGISADAEREGSAGDVMVVAATLSLSDGARLESSTFGPGSGGNITVKASDTVSVDGPSQMSVQTLGRAAGAGDAGTIMVTASRVTLTKGGQINSSTSGLGQAGNVTVTAADTVAVSGNIIFNGITSPSGISAQSRQRGEGAGNAGAVMVMAPRVLVTDGALISSSTFGPGRAGTVTVAATDTVTVSGVNTSSQGSFRSSISAVANGRTEGAGDAGGVVITAPRVLATDGALINSATGGPGQGGNITINARDLQLIKGAELTAESDALGQAGNISITVTQLLLIDQGEMRTSALQADGGDVTISANLIQLQDGQLTTSVGQGEGRGGNIRVDAGLGLMERGEIRADAFGGPGGNITIQTNGFITDVNSVVSASSAQSVDGAVTIQGLADLSGSLTPIDPTFASDAILQSHQCTRRRQGEGMSRFTRAGRNRIPIEPGGLLPSPSSEAFARSIGQSAQREAVLLSHQPFSWYPASALMAANRDCVHKGGELLLPRHP